MIPYAKLSKKEKKKFNKKKRALWDRKPATQVVPNKKAYSRQENKRIERIEGGGGRILINYD